MTDLVVDPEPSPSKRRLLPLLVGLLAVVALIIGVVVIVADGDGGGIDDPVTLIGAAPDAARDAGSARMTMTMEMSGADMPMDLDLTGEGLVDFVAGASTFEMSMFGMVLEMRFIQGTMYMRLPEVGRPATVDKEWVAMPLTMAGGATGALSPNAAGFLESLRGVSSEVDEIGSQQVNGQDATGYRATIDMASAVEQVPDQYREQVEASMAQMGEIGMDVLPVEIWVTDDGLPVRMVMDMTTDLFDMKMTMDYTDFGVDVDIAPPPADDTITVTDAAQLQELMGGASLR